MNTKKIKYIINTVSAAIGLAMGIAVIVLTTLNNEISQGDINRMLAIACVSLGIFALNNIPGEKSK